MIIKMQGADITTTDNSSYGAITNYNNTGSYEVRTVFSVTGNTIYLCQGLTNAYTQSGRSRIQVIRIPRLNNLTVGAGATITGLTWNGTTGGIVAIETNGNITVNGNISANAIGFRGGTDDLGQSSSFSSSILYYRATATTTSAGKGESIAGNSTDYDASLNGAYGRGAPANGGGGGNGHNSGGGGGSNAGTNGVLTPWNGTGIKSTTTAAWANAWNLEAAGFALNVSTGAGRGGYSYSTASLNALTIGPGNSSWNGDDRKNNGGFGGRPLDYNSNTRLFFGGGGGSGDGNDDEGGEGGNGGGIIYLLVNGNISGSGTVTANGQDGLNTTGSHIDAAGGGGGGGAILAMANGSITGVTMRANGGKGGDQLPLTAEAEGPGGGGGGGYIGTTATSISRQVNGGTNGITNSTLITEFLPNGATRGNSGTIASVSYTDALACNALGFILPVKMISFDAELQHSKVLLKWVTSNEVNNNHFEIEMSTNAHTFTPVAVVLAKENVSQKLTYDYADNISLVTAEVIYYRLKIVDNDNEFTYSDIRAIRTGKEAPGKQLTVYPNPALNNVKVILPAAWPGRAIRFDIYDVNGKKILSAQKNKAGQAETIDVQSLKTGYYILQAAFGAETLQQKLIKG
jgi:hypothetical protein